MVPSPTVSEVIPFQIIMTYGSLPDSAKMVIPAKIFCKTKPKDLFVLCVYAYLYITS